MSEARFIRSVSQTFQSSLIAMCMLAPSALTAYMYFSVGHQTVFESIVARDALSLVIIVTAVTVAFIAYSCYRSSGEAAMLYMVWGLTTQALSYGLRLTLPIHTFGSIGNGAGPRVLLSILLILALIRWRSPHDSPACINWIRCVLKPVFLLVVGQFLAIGILALNPWFTVNHILNSIVIGLAFVGLIQAFRLFPINRPMYFCIGALILNAQSATAFLISEPWCHAWWLGQFLCLTVILVLGHTVTLAFLTSQSLSSSQTEQQILALMHQAEESAHLAHRADAAKTRFMAAASHDLRQPLVPIKLFAELLEAETHGTPQGTLVRKLRSAVESLDELLNKMMEFSRLESGVVHTRSERVRLGDVLERFHQTYGPVAEAEGLELRWVDTAAVVRTDRVLLEQILRNLVKNAIRYTKTGKILIGCRRRGATVRLCVYDTGIGIPYDQQPNIFTEFYQGTSSHNDHQVGLGLGLATVDRLSKLLEVPVDMVSVPGQGSCFAVTLPRTNERRAHVRPKEVKVLPDPGPLRILLLDDQADVREGLIAALLRRDWEPLVATTIEEAIETVESEGAPDAFITDLRLGPDECGLDAIDAITKLVGHSVAAIIITGDASHSRLAEATASPWPILVKPFSMDELYTAVTEMVLKARASANVGKM